MAGVLLSPVELADMQAGLGRSARSAPLPDSHFSFPPVKYHFSNMASVIEEIDAGSSGERYDEALQNLLAQHCDDPQRLLATVFGFLQRHTSYLSQPDVQQRVTGVLQTVTGAAVPAAASGVKSGFFGKAVSTSACAASLPTVMSSRHTAPRAFDRLGGRYISALMYHAGRVAAMPACT